ncbi:MAG: M23 family metallopeptidase [Anaerolineales bacterium]
MSVRSEQGSSVETPDFTVQATGTPLILVPTTFPVPTMTLIPCEPTAEDFCIVDGNFIFQNPLGPDSAAMIARSYPYGSTDEGRRDPHHGVDIESKEGASVFASAAGEVIFAGPDREQAYASWKNYYGNVVVVRHADGLYTLYGHLSQIYVSEGGRVKGGDLIAAVGHTGVALGSHLHFEVRSGGDGQDYYSTENPELWLTLQDGMGALSITLDMNKSRKVQRNLVVWRYFSDTNTPQEIYYASTYPKGFEQNKEDCVLSNLPPGRYRIAFTDSMGLHERVVNVEAGKLTQLIFDEN